MVFARIMLRILWSLVNLTCGIIDLYRWWIDKYFPDL